MKVTISEDILKVLPNFSVIAYTMDVENKLALSEAINKIIIAAKTSDNMRAAVKQTLTGGGTGA